MAHERGVELLKAIGMSGYEAKAYVALLAAGQPLNGYEVAKASGVPRSTVYESLAKLVARGAAFEVTTPSGVAYLALPADTLVGRLRRELAGTIDDLGGALASVAARPAAALVQHVHGTSGVVARAIDVIEGAQESLFISMWPHEREALAEPIRRARRRGVEVFLILFGEADDELGPIYAHRFSTPEVVLDRLGCRIFTLVADRDAVLIAGADGDDVWGVWSDDPAIVLVASEYVRHDIALQVIAERVDDPDFDRFWHDDPQLERLREASASAASQATRAAPPGKRTPQTRTRGRTAKAG